jgi:hypothetical protein
MNLMIVYFRYLEKCKHDNTVNLRDPNHDYMEWNHTFPQCLFKGHGPGQWLTFEQHAIASALQTLAFDTNCLFGGMLKHLPNKLLDLCLPYYSEYCRKSGAIGLEVQKDKKTQSDPEVNARRSASLKKTLSDPEVKEKKSNAVKGDKNPQFGLKGELSPIYGLTRSTETRNRVSASKTGTKRWVNPEGKWVYRKECPGPEWKLAKPNK